MSEFRFDASIFVQPGFELANGDWDDETVAQINTIRANHPELSGWGNLAIGCAFGGYSQDILAVGWADWIRERNLSFLAYIYVKQLAPEFDFGGTGQYYTDIDDLGKQTPWVGGNHQAPSWAQHVGSFRVFPWG